MPGSSLELSPSTEERLLAAAAVLRISPDAFLRRLLSQHYNTLGGLPIDLLRYIISFLDYSTVSGLVARVSKFWQDCVLESSQNYFSRLRQMHGIHLIDPVHGVFYFPRALKRVVFDTKGSNGSGAASSSTATSLRLGGYPRHTSSPTSATLQSSPQAVLASSFLTVDIRTQNTKSLPWGSVQMTVRRAIEREWTEFGTVRTPGLQHPEDPVWSQAATVTYDRHIYMFGGETYEGVVLDRAYVYDPMTKHWAVLPDLNEKRASASAVAFHGRIFVFGGYSEEGEVLDTYEVLDVATRSWVSQLHPPSWLYTHTYSAVVAAASHKMSLTLEEADHADLLGARASTMTNRANQTNVSQLTSGTVNEVTRAAASQYRMPERICGTAATVYGDVIVFAGGHRSCIAPDQTAVSYSAMNSASTTPMHSVGRPYAGSSGGPSNRSVPSTPSPGFGNPNTVTTNNSGGDGASSGRSALNGTTGSDFTSATANTPVLGNFDGLTTPATAGVNNNNITSASTRTNSPLRLPRVSSIAFDGPATAETLVWVFSPLTGQWWRDGPRLPSPRAFGALTVLELPVLGPCLCYFGGCAKADAPETAMFYIPLCDAPKTRLSRDTRNGGTSVAGNTSDNRNDNGRDGDVLRATMETNKVTSKDANAQEEGGEVSRGVPPPHITSFLHSAQDPWPVSLRGASPQSPQRTENGGVRVTAAASPNAPPPVNKPDSAQAVFAETRTAAMPLALQTLTTVISAATSAELNNLPTTSKPPTDNTHASPSTVDMVALCFRNTEKLPWQRYVRVPIGGAFTSVAVLGSPHSRTVVLTGFYPAPNIGFCKVNHLLPPDAFAQLLGEQSLSPPPAPLPSPQLANTTDLPSPPQPQLPDAEERTGRESVAETATAALTARPSPPSTLPLDASLQNEAAAAANHYHQERERSHHQRQEVRELVRSAARAATLRHPRNPQMAGEERKWSLAPVPEVRVRNPAGPALTRVSWKVQSLNAKVIVGIE